MSTNQVNREYGIYFNQKCIEFDREPTIEDMDKLAPDQAIVWNQCLHVPCKEVCNNAADYDFPVRYSMYKKNEILKPFYGEKESQQPRRGVFRLENGLEICNFYVWFTKNTKGVIFDKPNF